MTNAPRHALHTRQVLPADIPLLRDAPDRADWRTHPGFSDLVAYWLDRHALFRQLNEAIIGATRDHAQKALDPAPFAQQLSRQGALLLGELQTHHHVEDHHYFPMMVRLEPTLQRGFTLLDQDHTAFDASLHSFADQANEIIAAIGDDRHVTYRTEAFADWLIGFGTGLTRHLEDEEDIIIPVLLKHRLG